MPHVRSLVSPTSPRAPIAFPRARWIDHPLTLAAIAIAAAIAIKLFHALPPVLVGVLHAGGGH